MIAQETPSEGLSYGLFEPLLFAALVYAVLVIAARVLAGRGDARAGRLDDLAFALLIVAGAYVVVLAAVALASEVDLVWDMLVTTFVITVFFLALLLVLLVLAERGIGGLSRLRRRR